MFNKLYEEIEDIFKPASVEDIEYRKSKKLQRWISNFEKRKDVTKNPDGTYDVDGDVDLFNVYFTELPIRFNIVDGNFFCTDNYLTTLVGCPKEVTGSFYCSDNELTSLKGCPITVGRDFDCIGNELTSLANLSKYIGGYLFTRDNKKFFRGRDIPSECTVVRGITNEHNN